MQSKAKTVTEYLKELPAERREALSVIRKVILDNLPEGFKEGIQYGMIGYFVPLELYPKGYLDDPEQPLPFAALASQKNHMAVYLMGIYGDKKNEEWFKKEYKKTGKKMNVGKSCVRFTKLDDVPLELIGQVIAKASVKEWIKRYEAARTR